MNRVPRQLLPHTAVVTPCIGQGGYGPEWADDPDPAVAAASWPASGRTVSLDGQDFTAAQRLFLDEPVPLRSRVTTSTTGDTEFWVVAVKPWSHPRATYCELTLATAPAR